MVVCYSYIINMICNTFDFVGHNSESISIDKNQNIVGILFSLFQLESTKCRYRDESQIIITLNSKQTIYLKSK